MAKEKTTSVENEIIEDTVENTTEETVETVVTPVVTAKAGTVISRANHPITLKIGSDEIILSPRQRKILPDVSNLKFSKTDAKYLRII
jgi:hypothetical protein